MSIVVTKKVAGAEGLCMDEPNLERGKRQGMTELSKREQLGMTASMRQQY